MGIPSLPLPLYQCHKRVRAVKIHQVKTNAAGQWVIVPDEDGIAPIVVTQEYMAKHSPQAGGYFLVYDDCYRSFSPAAPFESGYTRVKDGE